ncbi:hypothetical protein ACIMS2_000652 [Vibrio harveyi]
MAHKTGNYSGTALDALNQLVTFLTTDATLTADGDVWSKLGETSTNITHPTDADVVVDKGIYLKGNTGGGTAPILFVYAARLPDKNIEALCFTSMLGYDASLVDQWWLQAGSSKLYAVATIAPSGGSYEFMANGRRFYGYFDDAVKRMFPFYAGWIIPYVDVQSSDWAQPTACLGSDKNVKRAFPASTSNHFSVGLTVMYESDETTFGGSSNFGAFLMMRDGRFERIQGQGTTKQNIYSPLSIEGEKFSFDRKLLKRNMPITYNGKTMLFPEVLVLSNVDENQHILLGELDGLCSIGAAGAAAGAVVDGENGVKWVVIKQRNAPYKGNDGYAMRRT